MTQKKSAIIGFLLSLPIAVLLSSIVFRITVIESFLKMILTNDGDRPNGLGFAFMIGGLVALPFALAISLWPMLRKDKKGKRHFYLVNALVAVLVLILMIPTWGALAEEVYRCDVLQVPNCD